MKGKDREPGQLPLLHEVDMGPPEDIVGAALGMADGEPAGGWDQVMDLFAKLAVRAYYQAQAGGEEGSK